MKIHHISCSLFKVDTLTCSSWSRAVEGEDSSYKLFSFQGRHVDMLILVTSGGRWKIHHISCLFKVDTLTCSSWSRMVEGERFIIYMLFSFQGRHVDMLILVTSCGR